MLGTVIGYHESEEAESMKELVDYGIVVGLFYMVLSVFAVAISLVGLSLPIVDQALSTETLSIMAMVGAIFGSLLLGFIEVFWGGIVYKFVHTLAKVLPFSKE